MSNLHSITLEELEAAVSAPIGGAIPRSAWVAGLVRNQTVGLPLEDVLEIASEEHPGGPLATIHALLQGLLLRHQGRCHGGRTGGDRAVGPAESARCPQPLTKPLGSSQFTVPPRPTRGQPCTP